jgi:ribonuclease BN (tRNA processing enzyme)
LDRSACSVLVAVDGQNILLDIGPGTMRRLTEAGVRIFDIDAVCLSHFHPDHSGELVPFLFANKYPDGSRRSRPLVLVGGKGIECFFDGLYQVYGTWIDLGSDLFDIVALDGGGLAENRLGGVRLHWAPTAHNPESVALKIIDPAGRCLVYSGDTDVCESLIGLAQGADVLICEAALPDPLKVKGHLTPSEAGAIAARAGVGRLVLTHLYPQCDQADIVGQCRRTWAGPLDVAFDLMRLAL